MGGIKMSKRLALSVLGMLALGLNMGTAVAGNGHGATVEPGTPVSFVISSDHCSSLPAGATINGSGTQTSITTTKTVRGVTTVINMTHSSGNATDQLGNTYVWDYANHYSIDNSGAPDVFSGLMSDHFSLAGNGPYGLSNGFLGTFTVGPGDFISIDEINSRGDPIQFGPFPPQRCDPL
jgi:hypothetical protein